jgi:NADPH:quinone reductase-like Zn-dependent oxidoreductase
VTGVMRAAVAERPGPPDVLAVREVPVPEPRPGWTLVRVKAAGLNRSEIMTRLGFSPNVTFPRILGIECVGVIAGSVNPALPAGTTVAAIMGEMGREFDGGYAEYALVPDELLIPVDTSLDWPVLGALPETYLTAWGAMQAFGIPGDGQPRTLLVRGGSSSLGLAALSLARDWNLTTIATTRNPAKAALLTERGAGDVLVDTGQDAFKGLAADYVLDLIGAHSALGSLHLVKPSGTVCVVGMLSYDWVIEAFEPVSMIPSGAKLTTFHSEDLTGAAGRAPLAHIIRGVERGTYHANLDRVFTLDQIADAHRYMEANQATGKVVIQP